MSKHKDKDKERSRDDRYSRERERSRDRDHRRRSRDRSKERSRRKKSKERSRRSRSRSKKSSRRDRSRSRERSRRSRSRENRRSYSREHQRERERRRTPSPPSSMMASTSQSKINISAIQQAQITQFLSASLSGLTQTPQPVVHSISQPIIQQQDTIRTDFSNLFQSSTVSASTSTSSFQTSVPNSAALAIAAAKAKDLLKAKNLTDSLKISSNGDSVASNGIGGHESSHDDDSRTGLGSADNSVSATGDASNGETERRRKKKSRWASSNDGAEGKTFIPGMPTILPSNLNPDQQEAYLVQLQIEEISRKLRTGDLGVPTQEERRSPSPEPIYSSDGKRLNTREFRTRKKLEEQRHMLITRMQCMNPDFKPPADYKPPVTRVSDKVLIPQEEHPDINFVGLLIGPRGNTLKAMEKETGAKIIIRGKGSVKEGKVGRKDGQPLPGEDEPLHAFITASNPESVKKAVDKIKEVIKQGIEVPEGSNDLRRMQLRELAQLNGTLRETDGPRCTNCGSTDHKSFLCPDKPNVTNNIVCTTCGGMGHISKDCKAKRPGLGGIEGSNNQAKIDEEYLSLMAELGEVPPQQEVPAPKEPVQPTPKPYNIFESNRHQPKPIMPSNQNQNNSNPNNIPPLLNTPPPWHTNQHAPPVAPPPLPAHPMGQYPPQMPPWPPIPPMSTPMNRPPPNFPMNNAHGIPPPPPGCDFDGPPGTLPFNNFDEERFSKKIQPPLPSSNSNWGNMPSPNFCPPLPSFLPPPPPPET